MGMPSADHPPRHTVGLLRGLGYSLIILVGFLLLLEVLLRGYFFVANKSFPRARHIDDYLGWVVIPNIRADSTHEGFGRVRYSTNADGFRVFGDPASRRPKLLAIGDSQTQARMVSDGETWFDHIAAHSNAEVFAYGVSGYGTLQEYLVLDRFIDRIDPDMVLWQFCGNDPINNLFDLEARSVGSNHMTRPYLEGGEVVRRYPHPSWWFRNVVRESYLLRFIGLRLDIFVATHAPDSKHQPRRDGPLYERAFAVTSEILAMVRKRAGDRPVLSFSACGRDRNVNSQQLAKASMDNGIDYIAGVADAVIAAKQSGVVVDGTPKNKHWNATGHAIAGQVLLNELVRRGLVEHIDRQPGKKNDGHG